MIIVILPHHRPKRANAECPRVIDEDLR